MGTEVVVVVFVLPETLHSLHGRHMAKQQKMFVQFSPSLVITLRDLHRKILSVRRRQPALQVSSPPCHHDGSTGPDRYACRHREAWR